MVRYAAADYVGSLFRLAAYSLVPLFVLGRLGAEQNAYFSLAWVIAYTFYLAALNMGSSLIVEAARDPSRLAEHARRVLRNAGALIGAGVVVTVAAAPWLLRLFGVDYAENGTALLRLLALSALPNLLVGVAIDVARAQRRMRRVVALQCGLCVLVLGLTLWLIPVMGVTGVGAAWLLAESALAVPLLFTLRRWLGAPVKAAPATIAPATAAPATVAPATIAPGVPAVRPAPADRSPR
jgi:O-antigen/teichoic acid export membrane protein